MVQLLHSVDYVERAFADAQRGRGSERPYAELIIPTVYDPSIAPEGKHMASIFAQYVPADWAGRDERDQVEAFADRVVAGITELAPNFESLIEHRHILGPYEMEQEYGLIGGNIMHGDLQLDQMFSWRPVARWSDYRSPVRGFYLCGAGTHPGGGVSGASGHNAAREILRDVTKQRLLSKVGRKS
jgi:phytoene dehydrogenase-like protein